MMTTFRHWPLTFSRPIRLLLCLACLALGAVPTSVMAAEWKDRPTRYAVIFHQPEHANTAEQLAGMVDPIVEQLAALHDYTPRRPFTIRLYASLEAYGESSPLARTPYGQIAQAAPQNQELAIAEPRLRNLTPEQIRNLFRRGVSQLMLAELTGGRMPAGLLQGAAQYSEVPTPEVEVNARALDRARLNRALLSWADLSLPDRFVAQSEVAAAEGYSVVAFLHDRYGLAAWQRFIAATRTTPDGLTALAQSYGKSATALESEWHAYLPEYFGGSFWLNYFARYDLGRARSHLQAGRYYEARDELEAVARFVAGAGRLQKESELREVARQVSQAMEAELLVMQGQSQMASFQYAAARDLFQEAKGRFEAIGAAPKVEELTIALAAAESGLTAINQLDRAKRLLNEFKYIEAREAAMVAIKVFATLSDEDRYRQSFLIIKELETSLTLLAYVLGGLALANVVWAAWRLSNQARRHAVPGVLQ